MFKNISGFFKYVVPALACLLASALAADAATPAGKVISVIGSLDGGRSGSANTVPLRAGDEIYQGDNMRTTAGSSAVVMLNDGTKIYLSEEAKARVSYYAFRAEDEKRNIEIKVFMGRVGITTLGLIKFFPDATKKKWGDQFFRVITPVAELNTESSTFAVEVDRNGATTVSVVAGTVDVKNIKALVSGERRIGENISVKVKRDTPPSAPVDANRGQLDEFFGLAGGSVTEENVDGNASDTEAPVEAPSDAQDTAAEDVPSGEDVAPAQEQQ